MTATSVIKKDQSDLGNGESIGRFFLKTLRPAPSGIPQSRRLATYYPELQRSDVASALLLLKKDLFTLNRGMTNTLECLRGTWRMYVAE